MDTASLAHQGVIDLSIDDTLSSAPLRLDGEWEFYWKQLLSPEDFHGAHIPVVTCTIPSNKTLTQENNNG
jgi:hypothetical protein